MSDSETISQCVKGTDMWYYAVAHFNSALW